MYKYIEINNFFLEGILQASNTSQKAPRIDPRSIFNSYNLNDHEREKFSRFPEQFRAKKWLSYLSFENHITYSQTVTKFNKLIS